MHQTRISYRFHMDIALLSLSVSNKILLAHCINYIVLLSKLYECYFAHWDGILIFIG